MFHLLGVLIHSDALATVPFHWLIPSASWSNVAGFAAATAFDCEGINHLVPGLQRADPQWKEVPRTQRWGQRPGLPLLHYVDHYDSKQQDEQRYNHGHQHRPASKRQAEDEEWQHEEAAEDVNSSEPAVRGGDVAETFGQSDGDAGERNRIPESNASDVE